MAAQDWFVEPGLQLDGMVWPVVRRCPVNTCNTCPSEAEGHREVLLHCKGFWQKAFLKFAALSLHHNSNQMSPPVKPEENEDFWPGEMWKGIARE